MQGNVLGQKKKNKSFDINGIIEQYKVARGENISAGDFVKFINEFDEVEGGNVPIPGEDTQLSTGIHSGYTISAIELTDNKVFIAHSYDSNYHYLSGIVCTIDGTSITKGTDTTIYGSSSSTGHIISAVKLTDNKVFIAHSYNPNNSYLYGIVCTIDETTITKGTDTVINNSTQYTGYAISAVKLTDNKVFIAHSYEKSKYYLYGIVCTIDGTSITAGTDTVINNSSTLAGRTISAVKLTGNTVFIAHSYSSYYLYGIVCTIDETTITKGTDTAINNSTTYTGHIISTVKLTDNKVFIAHSYDSALYLYGIVCTIDGTTITTGTDTQLNTDSYSGRTISAVKLTGNTVFIAHSYDSSSSSSFHYLYEMICTIDDTIITTGMDTQLSTATYSGHIISAVLIGTSIFIAHSYDNSNYYLYGIVCNIGGYFTKVKQLESSSDSVEGVTKTGGNENEIVQVYVPNINKN